MYTSLICLSLHWPSYCSSNTLVMFLTQGLCTGYSLCLRCAFPKDLLDLHLHILHFPPQTFPLLLLILLLRILIKFKPN